MVVVIIAVGVVLVVVVGLAVVGVLAVSALQSEGNSLSVRTVAVTI
jgi:hypothetical protein